MIQKSQIPRISNAQLEAICKAIADTDLGLTGSEIARTLQLAGIDDVDERNTKWKRLLNALAARANADGHAACVLSFLRHAMEPARYSGDCNTFEMRRAAVNVPLAFVGFELRADGRFARVKAAANLSEAEARAGRLRTKLEARGVHAKVFEYCRAELLENNCFHAVLEATKSVAAQLRQMSGLTGDGAPLVDASLGGTTPRIRINSFATESEQGEQRGFCNLVKGLFGVFRNPTAHEPRTEWEMSEEDALDLFVLVSYVHRRLERGTVM